MQVDKLVFALDIFLMPNYILAKKTLNSKNGTIAGQFGTAQIACAVTMLTSLHTNLGTHIGFCNYIYCC